MPCARTSDVARFLATLQPTMALYESNTELRCAVAPRAAGVRVWQITSQ